jgi:hypothetical protein
MNRVTTITQIINMQPNEWINGSFKAVVTKTKDPQGKMPGKAVLVDPDNPSSQIEASLFNVYPTRWEGMICSFSKDGMKRTEYKGKPQISMGDKARIDVFQAPSGSGSSGGEPGKHMPIAVPQSVIAATKVDFASEMAKIGMMYIHAVAQARNASAVIQAQHGIEMTEAMFQSCVASIFIEANRNGLAKAIPMDPIKTPAATAKTQEPASDQSDENGPF